MFVHHREITTTVSQINIIFPILGTIIGAIIALSGTWWLEQKKRKLDKEEQEIKNTNILNGLVKEIDEGVKRTEALVNFIENNKFSFSRIYTALWDSVKFYLCQNIKDYEMVGILHKIYLRFDLINFNLDHDRFGVGAAFAKQYIDEIKKSFNNFIEKLENFNKK